MYKECFVGFDVCQHLLTNQSSIFTSFQECLYFGNMCIDLKLIKCVQRENESTDKFINGNYKKKLKFLSWKNEKWKNEKLGKWNFFVFL